MPARFCMDCGALFDRESAPGLRCPACQPAATRQRQKRPPSGQRGYGADHRKLRARLIAAFRPGQPCARCGQPIATTKDAQLGHDDADRTQYRGLEHVRCNESTSTRR